MEVHILEMAHGKANAIDESLLDAVSSGLRTARDENKNAVVITGRDDIFSAGLNLKNLPDTIDGMRSFVERFEEVMLELVRFPLPLVAAINGHAIAGGCVLACTADIRIGAAGEHKLGVSEVSLGIVFPATAFEIMRYTLEARSLPDVLLGGELLSPEEAREAGILHSVVARDRLLDEAVSRAGALGNKPPAAFRHSKLALREPMLERIASSREEAARGFLESWFSPDVVERRRAMLNG